MSQELYVCVGVEKKKVGIFVVYLQYTYQERACAQIMSYNTARAIYFVEYERMI